MSGPGQADQGGAVPVVVGDEDALRSLEVLLLSCGMGTVYVAEMPSAGEQGPTSPGLRVFDGEGSEIACVVVARRSRMYLVSWPGLEGRGLVHFRTAGQAAALICGYQYSPAPADLEAGG